jgi:hypothetical protein
MNILPITLIAVACLSLASSASIDSPTLEDRHWLSFKNKYPKVYKSEEEPKR